MTRQTIFSEIESERAYQESTWGLEFDKKNTANDWLAYIVSYTGKALTLPWDKCQFRSSLIKVATLCVAAIERCDENEIAKRHYDD